MKKYLLIGSGILGVLIVMVVIGGFLFLHVTVDETRVQEILSRTRAALSNPPTDNRERLTRFNKVAERFEVIEEGLEDDDDLSLWEWDEKHFFDRESILPEEIASLKQLVIRIDAKLIEEYQDAVKRLEGTILIDVNDPLKKSDLDVISSLAAKRLTLIYCDYLAFDGQWDQIWPLLKSNLILAEQLSKPPTSILFAMVGRTIAESSLKWFANAIQALPPNDALDLVAKQMLGTTERMKNSQATFTDVIEYEMFFFDYAYHSLNLDEQLKGNPIGKLVGGVFERDWKIGMKHHLETIDTVKLAADANSAQEALRKLEEERKPSRFAPLSSMMLVPWSKRYLKIEHDEFLKTLPELASKRQTRKFPEIHEAAPSIDNLLAADDPSIEELIEQKPSQVIKKQISQVKINKALEDLDKLYTEIRAVPHFRNGRVLGLKILSVRAGSIFDQAGLERGDILLAINKIPFDVRRGFEIFQQLKESNRTEWLIFKKGVLIRIDILIRD